MWSSTLLVELANDESIAEWSTKNDSEMGCSFKNCGLSFLQGM